jgi:hypothetical protein
MAPAGAQFAILIDFSLRQADAQSARRGGVALEGIMTHRNPLRSVSYCLSAALLLALVTAGFAFAAPPEHAQGNPPPHAQGNNSPLVIEALGSFAFAGKVEENASGQSRHCDHGYADFTIPKGARDLPILLWHAISVKLWRSNPSFLGGLQGFEDIFLHRGFGVYIIDPPRQGRASYGCFAADYVSNWPQIGEDQSLFSFIWRFGTWIPPGAPTFFPNTQTPAASDPAFLDQILRAEYPDNEDFPDSYQLEAESVAKLLEDIGPVTLMTHSSSGRPGWLSVIESPKVKGVVSLEPIEFLFPSGELPPTHPDAIPPVEVPLTDFQKLTQIPILVVFGDFLNEFAFWSATLSMAQTFVETVNNHGGNATLLVLPDVGIFGNTHALMLDQNNVQIADLISQWLKDNGLDKH